MAFKGSRRKARRYVRPINLVLDRFQGLDYLHPASAVSNYRFPQMENLIANQLENLESRDGIRTLSAIIGKPFQATGDVAPRANAKVKWFTQFKVGSINEIIIAINYDINGLDGVYCLQKITINSNGTFGSPVDIFNNALYYTASLPIKVSSFVDNGKLYLLTGAWYLVYDGVSNSDYQGVPQAMHVSPYVPTVMEGCGANGSNPNAQPAESPNVMTPRMKRTFVFSSVVERYFAYDIGKGLTIVNVSLTLDNGTSITLTLDSGNSIYYSYDSVLGLFGLNGVNMPKNFSYSDNLSIEYFVTEDLSTNSDIDKCTVFTTFSYGGDNRYVFSGNPSKPNMDWVSDTDNPCYFPDDQFRCVGSSGSKIMGYCKYSNALGIIKSDSPYDAVVHLRTAELIAEKYMDSSVSPVDNVYPNKVLIPAHVDYPVKEGISGNGAVNEFCFGLLLDRPLFLSKEGVMSLVTNDVTSQRSLKNESMLINNYLTTQDLTDATAIVHKGKYYLAVGDDVFVADGRQYSDQYGFEWYKFTDIRATAWAIIDGSLFFIRSSYDASIAKNKYTISLCRFNDDVKGDLKYNDDGKAFNREVTTAALYAGLFLRKKTIQDMGTGVMFGQSEFCSARVFLSADGNLFQMAKEASFDSSIQRNNGVVIFSLDYAVPNILIIQFKIQNNTLNEGISILGIESSLKVGTYGRGINNET